MNSDSASASPRVTVEIDRERAAALQVAPLAIEDALYTAFGSRRVSVINAPKDQYEVLTELEPGFRLDPGALSLVYVRSARPASSCPSTRSRGSAAPSVRSPSITRVSYPR